jgi:hypothetical protein
MSTLLVILPSGRGCTQRQVKSSTTLPQREPNNLRQIFDKWQMRNPPVTSLISVYALIDRYSQTLKSQLKYLLGLWARNKDGKISSKLNGDPWVF